MSFNDDMPCQAVDLDILILFVQKNSQLIPQSRQIASDLTHSGQVQIPATLVFCVYGEITIRRPRNMVFWRG